MLFYLLYTYIIIHIMKEEHPMQPLIDNKQQSQSLVSSIDEQGKLPKKAAKSLQNYRKKLLVQVITIFLICLIVILERVFYQIIVEAEENTLASFQLYSDLSKDDQYGKRQAGEITNGFLKFFASLSEFPVQFLFLTHVLATMYVAFDALVATKVIFVTLATVYFVSVIQLFY